jgi:hypothetical protein
MNHDTRDQRDPHLLAALRHAPDRDAAPPPELTARILAAARAAVQASAPSPLQRALAWFASPRLGAAFATLAVAVLVGVMWSSQEPPVPESVTPPLPQAGREQAAAAEVSAPVAAAAAPAPAAPAPAQTERRTAKAKEADRPQPARSHDRSDATQTTVNEAAAKPLPQTVAPLPAEALARADAAPAGAPAPPASRARAESSAVGQAGTLAAAKQAAAPAMLADKAAAFDPLLALDAAGNSGAWSWRAADSGERAHGEPQRALWAALRAATQDRWGTARAPLPSDEPWLVLREGARRTEFRLIDDALVVTDAEGHHWRAQVTPGQVRDWQRSVARW